MKVRTEAFRKTLMKAIPTLLTGEGAKPDRDEQMETLLEGMNARNWKASRDKLLALLKDEKKKKRGCATSPVRRRGSESWPRKSSELIANAQVTGAAYGRIRSTCWFNVSFVRARRIIALAIRAVPEAARQPNRSTTRGTRTYHSSMNNSFDKGTPQSNRRDAK